MGNAEQAPVCTGSIMLPCKASLLLATQMSHRDDFVKFAVISQTGCKGSGFLKPHPLRRRTPGVAHDSQRFCQGTKTTSRGGGGDPSGGGWGVTPVAGGGQAPASWVKKLGPGQGLRLGIQLRPLAAATPRAACSSRSWTSPRTHHRRVRKCSLPILASETRLGPPQLPPPCRANSRGQHQFRPDGAGLPSRHCK